MRGMMPHDVWGMWGSRQGAIWFKDKCPRAADEKCTKGKYCPSLVSIVTGLLQRCQWREVFCAELFRHKRTRLFRDPTAKCWVTSNQNGRQLARKMTMMQNMKMPTLLRSKHPLVTQAPDKPCSTTAAAPPTHSGEENVSRKIGHNRQVDTVDHQPRDKGDPLPGQWSSDGGWWEPATGDSSQPRSA